MIIKNAKNRISAKSILFFLLGAGLKNDNDVFESVVNIAFWDNFRVHAASLHISSLIRVLISAGCDFNNVVVRGLDRLRHSNLNHRSFRLQTIQSRQAFETIERDFSLTMNGRPFDLISFNICSRRRQSKSNLFLTIGKHFFYTRNEQTLKHSSDDVTNHYEVSQTGDKSKLFHFNWTIKQLSAVLH